MFVSLEFKKGKPVFQEHAKQVEFVKPVHAWCVTPLPWFDRASPCRLVTDDDLNAVPKQNVDIDSLNDVFNPQSLHSSDPIGYYCRCMPLIWIERTFIN